MMSFSQRFKKLGWPDVAVMAAGIGVIVYFQLQREPADPAETIEIAIFSAETAITLETDLPEVPSVQEAYEKWSNEPEYFGAFAVSEDGQFGWTERYGAPWTARIGAVAFCERSGSSCSVIAVSLPEDYEPTDAETLEVDAMNGWAEYRSKPGAKAYAHSPLGIAHWSWGYSTVMEAERVALSKCETRVREYGEGKPIPHWPCLVLRSER